MRATVVTTGTHSHFLDSSYLSVGRGSHAREGWSRDLETQGVGFRGETVTPQTFSLNRKFKIEINLDF